MTERMIALLKELREAASDERETAIVEECARKLESSAKIEEVDEMRQRFNGHEYVKSKGKSGYYRRSEPIHHAVYEYYCGVIPSGYVIHHIDCDPSNNQIENLRLMTAKEHREEHGRLRQAEYECDYCGKKIVKSYFKGNEEHHFCDGTCKALWRTKVGKNDMEMECVVCGARYVTRRRGEHTRKTCSKECHSELLHRNLKLRTDVGNKNSVMVEYEGRRMMLSEAARLSGISYSTLRHRIKSGKPLFADIDVSKSRVRQR